MTGAVPARLVHEPGETHVEWLATDGTAFTEPFFEQTLARLRRAQPRNSSGPPLRTPLSALAGVSGGVPPAAFIFHVSRCGSTLVTQMLATLPQHIVIPEAPILDNLLRFPAEIGPPAEAEQVAWLRGAVTALGQPKSPPERRLFLKLDCWHIFHAPLLRRAFPETPFIFVHRHPVEVLVSLMRMPSFTLVRDVVTPAQLGLSTDERDRLSQVEHAAAILGAFFRAAREHRPLFTAIDYQELPRRVWEDFPGLALTDAERAHLQTAAGRDAKRPNQAFTADSTDKRRAASPELLAAFAQWTEPHYRRWLEILAPATDGPPLPRI